MGVPQGIRQAPSGGHLGCVAVPTGTAVDNLVLMPFLPLPEVQSPGLLLVCLVTEG